MFCKGRYVKSLVPSQWYCYGEVVPSGRSEAKRHVLKGESETPNPFFSSFSHPSHEVRERTPTHAPIMIYYLTTGPKSNQTNRPWTETSKTMNQNNLFLFISGLYLVFVTVTGS